MPITAEKPTVELVKITKDMKVGGPELTQQTEEEADHKLFVK